VKFTKQDVADYYNQTFHQYQRWWKLDKDLSLHYGIWDENTRNFSEALKNTNRVIAEIASINAGERVLDAGCGVGGSAIYLAANHDARVSGVTLSEKQMQAAINNSFRFGVNQKTDFRLEDYTKTSFKSSDFDLVLGIESITTAFNKRSFAKEANRLLKVNGKLIIADYFKTSSKVEDPEGYLTKLSETWSMAPIESLDEYIPKFESEGFELIENHDYTKGVYPTVKRMYISYLLGAIPSIIFNVFNPKSGKFGKLNYKSGLYQYKAMQKGYWQYRILLFEKK